jgi:glycosyltransferase involved in cell wall biosynthesis
MGTTTDHRTPEASHDSPAVSVVIPSYRASSFIATTVRSVLTQTLATWEMVIVDDHSDDDTVAVARHAVGEDPRVRIVVNERNLGPAANWNRAVSLSSAPYVKVLCSDDVLLPTCLAQQVAALDTYPSAGLVAARRDIIDGNGRVRFAGRGLQGLEPFMTGGRAIAAMVAVATTPFGEPSVVLMRRKAMETAGPFSQRYGTLIDVDMYARLLKHWDCVAIEATLAQFRMSPASWSDRSHREQGRNARRFLRDLASDPALSIGRRLLLSGLARTFVNSLGRRAAFALHR